MRNTGTVSRGIRCPIIRQGDPLAEQVTNSILTACETDGFSLRDRDVVAVTESSVTYPSKRSTPTCVVCEPLDAFVRVKATSLILIAQ